MSHDDKSTRERWTQLKFSGENATLKCARIKTFVPSYTRTFDNKVYTRSCVKENNLTKRIAWLLSGERKKKKKCV